MNQRQTELYNNLMLLVANEAFYFVDQQLDNLWYRVFSYRLASYTDFLQPDALECRGHMFQITEPGEDTQPVRLASWVLPKFFNWNENQFTIGLDLSTPVQIMVKKDGSLISTFYHNNELRLKSKTSLSSDQVVQAMEWLDTQHDFKWELQLLASLDKTVNLELCGPYNRIVIDYPDTHLTVLSIRDNQTGETLDKNQMKMYPNVTKHWVETIDTDVPLSFVDSVASMTGVEGFVVEYKKNKFVKLKCDQYKTLHHAKDSVNNPRRLFEAILDEGIDDLRSMFYTDAVAMMMIDQMQKKVDHIFNSMVKEVESFYEDNKHLDRKDYALKGQKEVSPMYFSRVMNLYLNKDPDWKGFLKGKWKDLGFRDEKVMEEG